MSINAEALESWNLNAPHWDSNHGVDGNIYWQRLQQPCLTRLLSSRLSDASTPINVLELSTGNGICARWMASHGAHVNILATDGSPNMVEAATKRGDSDGRIKFDVLDVTSVENFQPFVEKAKALGGFDVILSNMAIQDIPTLEPMAAMLPQLLKKGGMFVAELLHPVFMTSIHKRQITFANAVDRDETDVRGKLIIEYLKVDPYKSGTFPAQPNAQIFFHRSFQDLFAVFFKNGLMMDALEEPSFTEEDAEPERAKSTRNFSQLPALLAFRLRNMNDSQK